MEQKASVIYFGHEQDVGYLPPVRDGETLGTTGKELRLEAITVAIESELDLGVETSVHVENIGWMAKVPGGVQAGTEGKGLRIEAVKINLTGKDAKDFDIFYGVHVQNKGDMNFAKNGASTGTEGLGLRVEAIKILVVKKGVNLTVSTAEVFEKYVAPPEPPAPPPTPEHPKKNGHAYLAVGHGINSNGAWDSGCVDGNYTEAGLMLPIVKAAAAYLRAWGVTVTTDADHNNNKNMLATVAEANAVGADYYISFHCDYNLSPSGTLPIVISDAGSRLANTINSHVMQVMGIGTRGVMVRDDYEVTGTDGVACIFELGSIRKDINLLLQADKYGLAMAQGIFNAL